MAGISNFNAGETPHAVVIAGTLDANGVVTAGASTSGSSTNPTYVLSSVSTPLGYQQILAATLATSTALTVPGGATYAIIQAAAAPVRWRDDATNPTTAIGMRLLADGELFYDGSLSAIRFIAESGSPILNISYYR